MILALWWDEMPSHSESETEYMGEQQLSLQSIKSGPNSTCLMYGSIALWHGGP